MRSKIKQIVKRLYSLFKSILHLDRLYGLEHRMNELERNYQIMDSKMELFMDQSKEIRNQ